MLLEEGERQRAGNTGRKYLMVDELGHLYTRVKLTHHMLSAVYIVKGFSLLPSFFIKASALEYKVWKIRRSWNAKQWMALNNVTFLITHKLLCRQANSSTGGRKEE